MKEIERFLSENSDEKKAKFDRGLINTKYEILGINIKTIEEFAKKIAKNTDILQNINISSHEEVLLCGFAIAYCRDSNEKKVEHIMKLLPYIDNWATTDSIVPRLKNMESQRCFFEGLLSHPNPFYVRFGIVWLKRFALKQDLANVIKLLGQVKAQDYYIKMAIAWTYQEALTIDFDFMFDVIKRLQDNFIRNKTISKACDSFRITAENKEKLKALRI
ncbi:MAG: DNA alkylation repair protein [Clostridia bacterium]|nr:DNA alkylation repair protein [Clostridia bacterium]